MKHLLFILITVAYSCRPNTEIKEVKTAEFKFSVYNNMPIFEDEYLYDKKLKKCIIEETDEIDIYYIDWNNNGQFKELGIDYLGIKSEQEYKPTIVKIDTTNSLRLNGQAYDLRIQDGLMNMTSGTNSIDSELHLITKLTPIVLENGDTFYPEFHQDTTVLYFWATWCRPCIETLKNIDNQKLNDSGIQLIPIAYNCSNSKQFLEGNKLPFEDLIISDESAVNYNIKSLSKQYSFLKNKKVSRKNVNLKEYHK